MRSQNPHSPHSVGDSRLPHCFLVVKERVRPKAPQRRSLKTGSEKRTGTVSQEGNPERLRRKEVIQPQVPLRLPCYDFTPVMSHFLGGCLLAVGAPTSVATHSHGVTGGVYKARERIHRCLLISDY